MEELLEDGMYEDVDYVPSPPISALGMGLTGSHRTGKTTLVKTLSEINEAPIALSSASAVAEEMGIDLTKPLSFELRLAFQERLLTAYEQLYASYDCLFFADRTPLDLAAYLIADVPNDLTDESVIQRVGEYVERCMAVTEIFFCQVTMVQPGIEYVPEPGKPLPNSAYQEAINTIILGLLYDDRLEVNFDVLPRQLTDHNERIRWISTQGQRTMAEFIAKVRELPSC
jgi:hypothetical protein